MASTRAVTARIDAIWDELAIFNDKDDAKK